MNKLRNIYTTAQEWSEEYFNSLFQNKIILFIINLDEAMPFVMYKSEFKKGGFLTKRN